jgi:hypothetical protein
MSPYSTGGGGVTFERKVAVQYLTHLLIGDGAVELGDGRFVVSVAFQQAPEHWVEYPPKAAIVDLSLLRRDAHQVLDVSWRRHRQG